MAKYADRCKNGHELTDGNVWFRPSDGDRVCRTCKNANGARYRARKRAEYSSRNAQRADSDRSQSKTCCRCKETKTLADFNRNSTKRDGHADFCRACMHEYAPRYADKRRKYYEENRELIRTRSRARYQADPDRFRSKNRIRKYGVSDTDVQAMLDRQLHQCGICYDPISISAHVDHDHDTGRVRGLLCTRCNVMIGYARDDIAHLAAAIGYLKHGPRTWSGIQVAVTLKEAS